ncbi:hypothetical protein C8R47DRAFT_1219225 [Mycena vitilis]|nr:hypothetical protein C8R47DRAFT_1219225 [Mycena vitilis]
MAVADRKAIAGEFPFQDSLSNDHRSAFSFLVEMFGERDTTRVSTSEIARNRDSLGSWTTYSPTSKTIFTLSLAAPRTPIPLRLLTWIGILIKTVSPPPHWIRLASRVARIWAFPRRSRAFLFGIGGLVPRQLDLSVGVHPISAPSNGENARTDAGNSEILPALGLPFPSISSVDDPSHDEAEGASPPAPAPSPPATSISMPSTARPLSSSSNSNAQTETLSSGSQSQIWRIWILLESRHPDAQTPSNAIHLPEVTEQRDEESAHCSGFEEPRDASDSPRLSSTADDPFLRPPCTLLAALVNDRGIDSLPSICSSAPRRRPFSPTTRRKRTNISTSNIPRNTDAAEPARPGRDLVAALIGHQLRVP